ncbi:hypothetical protein PISMIDRAFT_20263 [Pisolithus microcarpus 441]|uniref:Uncharacterized protein n=1 Tax=Pisolithus microcarpus 441 TaxID=765257 RepID=A0A0C9YJP5_9AGAM|nr:hypothetical protein PISMIDRAFT_20263 [Pisolithus microcarpus 441]
MFAEGHAEPNATIHTDIVEETWTKLTLRKWERRIYWMVQSLWRHWIQILHSESIQAIFEVSPCVSNVRLPFRAALPSKLEDMVKFIDTWREPSALDILAQITRLYKREVHVDLNAVRSVLKMVLLGFTASVWVSSEHQNDPFLVFQLPEIMSLMFYMNY